MQILFVCGKYHQTRERRPWQCSEWTGGLLLLIRSLGENFHLWTCSGGFFADREMVHTSHAWGKLARGFSCRICYTEECSGYWGFEAVLHLPVTKDCASISWHICGVWVSRCSLKAQPTDIVEMRGEFVLLSPTFQEVRSLSSFTLHILGLEDTHTPSEVSLRGCWFS